MGTHMLGQPINPLRQDRNLHLWGAGIGIRFTVVADYLGFSLFRDRHSFLVVYVVLLLTSWAVVYRCVKRTVLRAGIEKDSEKAGLLKAGETVTVEQEATSAEGVVRVKTDRG